MVKYQIRVQGWLGERWANWFDGMTLTYEGTADTPRPEGNSPITTLMSEDSAQASFAGESETVLNVQTDNS